MKWGNDIFLVKREDEPTNDAIVEPNSFGLYLARRRIRIAQRTLENQELDASGGESCSKAVFEPGCPFEFTRFQKKGN